MQPGGIFIVGSESKEIKTGAYLFKNVIFLHDIAVLSAE